MCFYPSITLLFIINSGFHKAHEKWVRINYRTVVFRMELNTNEPFQRRNFYHFHQTGFRILACTFHAGFFKLFAILAVEFETVAVTFLDMFFSISLIGFGTLSSGYSRKLPDA